MFLLGSPVRMTCRTARHFGALRHRRDSGVVGGGAHGRSWPPSSRALTFAEGYTLLIARLHPVAVALSRKEQVLLAPAGRPTELESGGRVLLAAIDRLLRPCQRDVALVAALRRRPGACCYTPAVRAVDHVHSRWRDGWTGTSRHPWSQRLRGWASWRHRQNHSRVNGITS